MYNESHISTLAGLSTGNGEGKYYALLMSYIAIKM